MSINIVSLPSLASTGQGPSLSEEIELGLLGTVELTVPGFEAGDREWSFKRRVPTVVLYDEAGLR